MQPVTQMVIGLIQDGSIPEADFGDLKAAMTPASPPTEGKRYFLKNVSPTYLRGLVGTLGKEPGQQTRLALYIEPTDLATSDNRIKRFLRTSPDGRTYLSVKMTMLKEL